MPKKTLKTVGKRRTTGNPIKDTAILQRTINQLRKWKLVPKGLYRFRSFKEADQWMLQKMVSTRVLQNSKT